MSLLCILGPTAVGKTELAIKIANRIDAEIVSVDSRQIYREMDIGTAKPTPEQLKAVPHYVIDCVFPDQPFSVADYQKLADSAIKDILSRGKVPMLVGGSGMYFRAVVDGLFEGPSADKKLREKLKQEALELGTQALYQKLRDIDPVSASKIHPNDLTRIIRALEVYERTGKKISELQKQWDNSDPRYKFLAFGLIRSRKELYKRINERVDMMIKQGLLDEVRRLSKYDRNLVSMNCFGYKELFSYIEGKCDLDTAIETVKRNIRRFAKRQLIWFKKDKRIRWIDLSTCPDPETYIIREFDLFRQSSQ